MRPHAKFCPYCGEKAAEEGTSGILSFDDFFEDHGDTRGKEDKEIKQTLQGGGYGKTGRTGPGKEKTLFFENTAGRTRKEYGNDSERIAQDHLYLPRQRKEKRVKVLDDTLELPIEEIQREIARRRERERMEQRSPEEKEASKKELEGVYDQLRKRHAKEDVLIPESEIVKDEDRPEKRSLLSRARDYLLVLTSTISKAWMSKKRRRSNREKARRAARREAKILHPSQKNRTNKPKRNKVFLRQKPEKTRLLKKRLP